MFRWLLRAGPAAFRPAFERAYGQRVPAACLRDFCDSLAQPGALGRWLTEGAAFRPPELELDDVATPSLVIHGDRDRQVPLTVARQFVAHLPRARLVVLRDAAHWPFATHAEAVARHVRAFLLTPH